MGTGCMVSPTVRETGGLSSLRSGYKIVYKNLMKTVVDIIITSGNLYVYGSVPNLHILLITSLTDTAFFPSPGLFRTFLEG